MSLGRRVAGGFIVVGGRWFRRGRWLVGLY